MSSPSDCTPPTQRRLCRRHYRISKSIHHRTQRTQRSPQRHRYYATRCINMEQSACNIRRKTCNTQMLILHTILEVVEWSGHSTTTIRHLPKDLPSLRIVPSRTNQPFALRCGTPHSGTNEISYQFYIGTTTTYE